MEPLRLSKWLRLAGWVCVVLGALLLSPLPDYLPLEVLVWNARPSDGHSYYRVVPSEGSWVVTWVPWVLLGLGGLLLLAATWRISNTAKAECCASQDDDLNRDR